MHRARVLLPALIAAIASLSTAVARAEVITMTQVPVLSTASMGSPGYVTLRDATILSSTPGTYGPVIDVRFNLYKGRLGRYAVPAGNWTGTNMLSALLENKENYEVRLAFMISTTGNENNFANGYYGEVVLPPLSVDRYCFVFQEPPQPNVGMKVLPKPFDGMFKVNYGNNNCNLANLWHWRFSNLHQGPARIVIRDFARVSYSLNFTGVADEFFQYTGRDWQTRILSIADLQAAKAAEDLDLAAKPVTGEIHGTGLLPNQGANPRWRVTTFNGKKFLVHPSGRLFWSFGLNGIHDFMSTHFAGREYMFESIPSPTGPNADLYVQTNSSTGQPVTLYRVLQHNMRQKYPAGTNLHAKFLEMANKRLDSWGINTAGSFSTSEVYGATSTRPYIYLLRTTDFPVHIPVTTQAWGPPPDPYASNFQAWMNSQFTQQLSGHNGNVNFMGVFVDNELSWGHTLIDHTVLDRYAVPLGVLSAPANQPAKLEFIRLLQRKYRTIALLNSSWQKNFSSWTALNAPITYNQASQLNANMQRDMSDFLDRFAAAYFTKVRSALTTAGCTALYMGSRFWQQTPEVVAAASNSVDVLSFNNYAMANEYDWTFLNSLRKPVIISEWSVNIDEGPTLGRIVGINRTQRGARIRTMLQTAMTQPNVVGLQWFEMYDMPVTNRGYDSENYGTGALTVTDTPHSEVVEAFRYAAANLYSNWRR